MEQQIQDLIASIKKEGIESATNESKKIIEEARKESERIIRAAREEQEKLIADGKRAVEIERKSSEAALRQAARDAALTLKASIESKFKAILEKKVSGATDAAFISSVLSSVVKAEFSGKDVVVELPAENFKAIADQVAASVGAELKEGISFRPSSTLAGGFRVSEKDGSAYIDLSDEECTKLLYPYVSSTLKELL